MLNGNGIPIGSSIRGLEDAIRTQRDMENTDPSEQVGVNSIAVLKNIRETPFSHLFGFLIIVCRMIFLIL